MSALLLVQFWGTLLSSSRVLCQLSRGCLVVSAILLVVGGASSAHWVVRWGAGVGTLIIAKRKHRASDQAKNNHVYGRAAPTALPSTANASIEAHAASTTSVGYSRTNCSMLKYRTGLLPRSPTTASAPLCSHQKSELLSTSHSSGPS